jgi:hypothetical protein
VRRKRAEEHGTLRENNYNTGLRGVLFDAEHYARMGSAVWLYGWLVLRQTHQTGTIGWVLGGTPIHYREIEEETGFNRRTLERWMKDLRRQRYIETAVVESGITIRILKAKKHLHRNGGANGVPKSAVGVREVAETVPQNCVANEREKHSDQQLAARISSSYVVRIKEREGSEIHRAVESEENCQRSAVSANRERETRLQNFHRSTKTPNHKDPWSDQTQEQNHLPSQTNGLSLHSSCRLAESSNHTSHRNEETHRNECPTQTHNQRPTQRNDQWPSTQQNFSWELRERMRLVRAERDDAVRRELSVGSGPEVRRP